MSLMIGNQPAHHVRWTWQPTARPSGLESIGSPRPMSGASQKSVPPTLFLVPTAGHGLSYT
jgi:hypothetical protein